MSSEAYDRVVRILLDALKENESLQERVEALEEWQAQVEEVWPLAEEQNDGTG